MHLLRGLMVDMVWNAKHINTGYFLFQLIKASVIFSCTIEWFVVMAIIHKFEKVTNLTFGCVLISIASTFSMVL